MTREDRYAVAARLYKALRDEGMSGPSAEKLAASVFDLPKDETFSQHERTGVFGLWDDARKRWVKQANGPIVYGPRFIMEAELRGLADMTRVIFSVREFGMDGRPILEPVEETVSSEAW